MQSTSRDGVGIPTAAQLHVWASFLRYHAQVVDLLEDELREEVGMPIAWYDVLAQLAAAPEGRLRMQELADAVVLSRSGLTRLVDRIESAGLVERASCPSDRRGTFATITDEGRARLEEARPVHRAGIARHFVAHLQRADIAALGDGFDALLRGIHH
jgi:DNA-binding MarR family transcriptional regulator